MKPSPEPHRFSPPYNPGVRDLVDAKRKWSIPPEIETLKKGFRGWHERGYLPHRDEPGLTQFVTFHLANSFPKSLRSEWDHLWKIEDDRQRRRELEAYLDKGRGACHLRRPDIARVVEDNFLPFRGSRHLDSQLSKRGIAVSEGDRDNAERYEIRAWCIMPNHVHVLFRVGSASMAEIVGSWKKHTGRQANRLLNKQGAFWSKDYFDTYMRDEEQERNTIHYIEENPVKARLVNDVKAWHWSSARFRDEFGILRF